MDQLDSNPLYLQAITMQGILAIILLATCTDEGRIETALLNYCRAGLGVFKMYF